MGSRFHPDDVARALVLQLFQCRVTQERAYWWTNENGGTELHLVDGEAFLLKANAVLRLR